MRAQHLHRRSVLKSGGSPPPRSPLSRLARAVGAVALALIATLALVVGGVWMVLGTRAGSEWARRLALPQVNARLAGRLEIAQLRFGGDHLTLRGVALRDPQGLVVARVGQLDVAFSPLSLLRRHLALRALRLEAPEIFLVQDQRGLNLGRAVAARNPEPAPPATANESAAGGAWVIDLGQLTIRRGLIDYRSKIPDDDPDDERHVRVADLALDGAGHFDAVRAAWAVGLQIDARAEAPLRPVSFHARADLHDTGDLLSFAARIAAGDARVEAHGDLDRPRLRTGPAGIAVHGRDIDLGQLWTDAPRSDLAFDLEAKGGGRDLASLDGSLNFSMPPGRLNGQAVGPVRLAAHAERGACQIASLLAVLPGLRIAGTGEASPSSLDVHLTVAAEDLGRLARSVAPPEAAAASVLPFALGGHGRLDLTLGGTPRRPTLQATGRFPRLALGDNHLAELSFHGQVRNLRDPLGADVDLRIATAQLGTRAVRDLQARLRAAGRQLTLDLRAAGPSPLAVSLGGRWGGARRTLTLDNLRVSYPEATWSLVTPARLSLRPGRLEIANLTLKAGAQLVRANFTRTGQALRGRLEISRFDLASLPRLLVPAELKLGGQLDVDGRIGGTDPHPEVEARVVLSHGRWREQRDLGFELTARYAGGRARGQLTARGLGTAMRAGFDLPVPWPPREHGGPLQIDLAIDETDLDRLQKSLLSASPAPAAGPARRSPLRGRARLAVKMEGTAADPRLAIDAEARELVIDGRQVGDLSLTLNGDGGGPLRARLALTPRPFAATAPKPKGGGASVAPPHATVVQIETALSLRSILRRPPTAQALLRTHFDLRADVEELPLALLAELERYPDPVGGQLSLHAALSGTALAPRGTLALDVAGASTGKFPPTDGHLEAAFNERESTASVRVLRKQATLLQAEAKLGAGLAAWRAPTALAAAPAHLHAVLGPLAVQCLGLPPRTERDPPRTLHGDVRAELAIDGTLQAPRVTLEVDAQRVRVDKAAMGAAQLGFDYRDHRAKLDARLTSANRGSLHLLAATTADLGYPAVIHGLEARKLPLDVKLQAEGFDVQGFSEVTADLRQVGGLLFASAEISGTVADPRFKGRVELKQGALTVTGFGAYHDVHLALHGDDTNLTLDELSAKSGDGHAKLTAQATHQGGRGYRFTAHAALDKFPLYSDGQALASVTADIGGKGLAAPLDVRAEVDVREARVALSDQKKKDLQSLKRPDDVVLVRGGTPLNRAQAAKAEALAMRRRGAKEPGKAGPAAHAATRAPAMNTTRIDVNAPRNFWVTGEDVYLELGLTPGFHVESTDETTVFGQVTVSRGRINVLGRRFDVKSESSLQFDGPPDRPDLNVTAQYTDRTDNINVLLTLKGPLDRLNVAVSSPEHPELNESQLYTLIITGHQLFAGSTAGSFSPSNEAASLVGGLVASRLQRSLASRLPLDVLTIDTAGAGITGTQLEAGTYLTDKLYVGYVGRVGADPTLYQNRNAVHLEYHLGARWSFDGEYGDVGTGSGDLIWTKRY